MADDQSTIPRHAGSRVSPRTARGVAGLLIAALAILPAGTQTPASTSLTESDRLVSIYDTILAARFDEAARALAGACPPAPLEACLTLEVVARWWRIVIDPMDPARDAAFRQAALTAVGAAERWTEREPARAEAWFYLAGAYGPLVQWRVLRGERLTAAREGGRIKRALDRALALDPALADAHFGVGLYKYYADVVPAAARIVQWLLLLPGGDREDGLRLMRQARERGQLLASEADFQLHLIYLWYERRPADALALLEGLDRQYPSNPLFLQRIAEVQCEYLHDHAASAATWQRLLDRARSGEVEAGDLATARALLGLAHERHERSELDRALDHLEALISSAPARPYGVLARAYLMLGRVRDQLRDTSGAEAAYTRAIQHAPRGDPDRIRDRVRDARRQRARDAR
jgi:tetratricopeptide (TPR) repeat protein